MPPVLALLLGVPLAFGLGVSAAVWYGFMPSLFVPLPTAFIGAGGISVLPAFEAGLHGGYYGGFIGAGMFVVLTVVIGLVVYLHFMGFAQVSK